MDDYTAEQLERGRFLWHFMGLDTRQGCDPTVETEAVPADATPSDPGTKPHHRPSEERASPGCESRST